MPNLCPVIFISQFHLMSLNTQKERFIDTTVIKQDFSVEGILSFYVQRSKLEIDESAFADLLFLFIHNSLH
jgi:hypothetical protein